MKIRNQKQKAQIRSLLSSLNEMAEFWRKHYVKANEERRAGFLALSEIRGQKVVAWCHIPTEKLLWPEEIETNVFEDAEYMPLVERKVAI